MQATNFVRTEELFGHNNSEVTYEGSITVEDVTISTVTVFTEYDDNGNVEFCNVIAEHDGEYADSEAFEQAISAIVGFDVQFTESGEQDIGVAVLA